jgi:hypothetical protein
MDNTQASFHPDAIPGFDRKGLSLVDSIVERPEPEQGQVVTPRIFPKATIKRSDIRNFREMTVDPTGTILSKFAHADGRIIGLNEEPYKELRLLAEGIQATPGFRNAVSLKALEEAAFDWAIARSLNQSNQNLCESLLATFNSRIKEYWVWIPIHGLITDFSLKLGRIELHSISPAFFETWESKLKHLNQWNESTEAIVKHTMQAYQGYAASTIRIVAEPIRARELAFEETENAMAILRTFQPCIMHPRIPSFIRPRGREHLQGSSCIFIEDDMACPPDSVAEEPFGDWILDQEMIDALISCGLGALHDMYLDLESDYARDLWKSIWTYSRSTLQKEPEDRLIYVFRALESFLLRGDTESIQQNIADRVAFTISSTSDERMAIVKTVKAVYSQRSKSVHHNQSIQEMDTVIEFLRHVFRFFVHAIRRREEFSSRSQFLESLDALKYH